MERITIKTKKHKEVVDVTDQFNEILRSAQNDKSGICHLFLTHTTAALTAADLDPGD